MKSHAPLKYSFFPLNPMVGQLKIPSLLWDWLRLAAGGTSGAATTEVSKLSAVIIRGTPNHPSQTTLVLKPTLTWATTILGNLHGVYPIYISQIAGFGGFLVILTYNGKLQKEYVTYMHVHITCLKPISHMYVYIYTYI